MCLPVLTEAFFLLTALHLRKRLEAMFEEGVFELYSVGESERRLAECFQWLEEYVEHTPDFTDAYLVVAASAQPSSRIWTFDKEFRTIWRMPNGRAVRLV